MDIHELYTLPQKDKQNLTRTSFIVYCIICDVFCCAVLNLLTVLLFESNVGYFSTIIVIILTDVFSFSGCLYYIHKHDYAYGKKYEKYQIVNAVIYGTQNYLRVLLAVLIINIMVVPIYYTIAIIMLTICIIWCKRRMI